MECAAVSQEDTDITSEVIIQHLISNNDVYFKSQQIGEEDLSINEKETVARNILDVSKSNFLARFGKYLKLEHMEYFKRCLSENSEDLLLNYHYNNLLRFHTKSAHAIDVRNRRYEALKLLIAENNYFTEKEMMKRNPLLYEQLIGKYLTEDEIKIRDGIDKKNITFVNLLMEGVERDIVDDVKMKQKMEENVMDEDTNSRDSCSRIPNDFNNTIICSTKNGPFSKIDWDKIGKKRNEYESEEEEEDTDDEEIITEEFKITEVPKDEPCVESVVEMETEPSSEQCTSKKFVPFKISTKKLEKTKKPTPIINGHISHREETRNRSSKIKQSQKLKEQCLKWGESENIEDLRLWKKKLEPHKKIKEIVMITAEERNMFREEFISLMYQSFLDGKDDFDYSTVDFNEDYDNKEIVEQDAEDKYFESESPNEDDDIQEKKGMECSSDDELDIFMERLNQHPTICQLSQDMKNL